MAFSYKPMMAQASPKLEELTQATLHASLPTLRSLSWWAACICQAIARVWSRI